MNEEAASVIAQSTRTDKEAAMIEAIMVRVRNPWAATREWITRQALLNHAFLNGDHYVKLGARGLEKTKRRYQNQVRLAINILRPLQRSVLGQLMRNEPILDIAEIGDDDYSAEAEVEVGRLLLRHIWGVSQMPFVMMNIYNWLFLGGNAAIRTFYDDDLGPMERMPKTRDGQRILFDPVDDVERTVEEAKDIIVREINRRAGAADPMLDVEKPELVIEAMGNRFKPILEPMRTGDIHNQVLSPFEFLTDPGCLNLHEAGVVIVEQARSIDWIRQTFGEEKASRIVPEHNISLLFEDGGGASLLPNVNLPRITQRSPYTGRKLAQDVAVVRELIVKAGATHPVTGKRLPKGLHFVWCQQTALTPINNPLPNEQDPEIDVVDFQFLPHDHFWSPAFFTDLLTLVKSNNRRMSQISETMNAFTHPKMLVQKGSKIRRGSPTDQAGEVVEYLGVPPSYMEPPAIRSYVFQMLDKYMESFNDVSMRHEVSRQGTVPANVRTYSGLQLLQEIDSEALAPTIILVDLSLTQVAEKWLDRVKEHWPENRTVSVVGKFNEVEAQIFRKAEFFQRRYKVFIHKGSSMPEFRATKSAQAIELLQYAPQLFVDNSTGVFDKRMLAQMMGRDDLAGVLRELDVTRKTAEEENLQLTQGDPDVLVFPFEDHEAHINIHLAHMKTNEFKRYSEDVQRAFYEHLGSHQAELQRIQEAQMRAQQQAMMSQSADAAVMRQNMAQGAAAEAREAVQTQNGSGGISPEQMADIETMTRGGGVQ